jgi:hypothetical protein
VQGFTENENNLVEIYDTHGRIIFAKEIVGSGIINLAGLANGIYVIKVGGVFQRIAKM